MRILLTFCFLVFGFFTISAQEERYVKFVDEAKTDASFFAFRTKLIAAAKRRDTKYILSVLDKEIQNSRNGTDGILLAAGPEESTVTGSSPTSTTDGTSTARRRLGIWRLDLTGDSD